EVSLARLVLSACLCPARFSSIAGPDEFAVVPGPPDNSIFKRGFVFGQIAAGRSARYDTDYPGSNRRSVNWPGESGPRLRATAPKVDVLDRQGKLGPLRFQRSDRARPLRAFYGVRDGGRAAVPPRRSAPRRAQAGHRSGSYPARLRLVLPSYPHG